MRERAVAAVVGGMTQVEAAKVLGVARGSVAGWMKLYREGGTRALKAKPLGRPKGLDCWRADQIVRAVIENAPDQLKLPYLLWTRKAVCDLIDQRFGVHLSKSAAGRMLGRWGLVRQKRVRRAREHNPKEIEDWLEAEYPRVRLEARRAKAEIQWGDMVDLRLDRWPDAAHGRKRRTPVELATGQCWHCTMLSSIKGPTALHFMVFRRPFTAEVFIEFMSRLINGSGRKIYLIVCDHPIHRARKVTEWLAQHEQQIRLIIMFVCSPDMNLGEGVDNCKKK